MTRLITLQDFLGAVARGESVFVPDFPPFTRPCPARLFLGLPGEIVAECMRVRMFSFPCETRALLPLMPA